MPQLMTHLVANYPSPAGFEQAVLAMFKSEVDFLEIQLPFSNPLADGPVIYQANQTALEYKQNLEQILQKVFQIQDQFKIKNPQKIQTKLLLMSYLTPILALGLENVVNLCRENNFVGFIIPDLIFGSGEQKTLSKLCQNSQMQLIPLISPLTKLERLEKIKNELELGQIVYAMARSGRTGNTTNLSEIQPYLDFLKQNLVDFKIAVGFGIKEKSQVDFLNQQNLIAVIGSEIIRQIQSIQYLENSKLTLKLEKLEKESNLNLEFQNSNSIYDQITDFLNNLKI